MRFIQSHSGPLGNIDGYIQIIPGTYKNEKPINIIGIHKVHLKCDCKNGSIVNGIREPILYSFGIVDTPGNKIYKESRVNFS